MGKRAESKRLRVGATIFDRDRHCEPPGRTKCAPDDRLHEAIQRRKKRQIVLIAPHKRGKRARYFVIAFAIARQI
jgi:hypothetical protein